MCSSHTAPGLRQIRGKLRTRESLSAGEYSVRARTDHGLGVERWGGERGLGPTMDHCLPLRT